MFLRASIRGFSLVRGPATEPHGPTISFWVASAISRSSTTSLPAFNSSIAGSISTSGAIPAPSNLEPSGKVCRTEAKLSIMPFSNGVKSVDEKLPAVVSPTNCARSLNLNGMTKSSQAHVSAVDKKNQPPGVDRIRRADGGACRRKLREFGAGAAMVPQQNPTFDRGVLDPHLIRLVP
jgi:hypothetical protein